MSSEEIEAAADHFVQRCAELQNKIIEFVVDKEYCHNTLLTVCTSLMAISMAAACMEEEICTNADEIPSAPN